MLHLMEISASLHAATLNLAANVARSYGEDMRRGCECVRVVGL